MALNFVKNINLTNEEAMPVPKYMPMLYGAAEPNSDFYLYYVDASRAYDKHFLKSNGSFESLAWLGPEQSITAHPVDYAGVKNVPNIGAVAFYKDTLLHMAQVLMPIHSSDKLRNPPTLKVEQLATHLHCILNEDKLPPGASCWRLTLRSLLFAEEYISYTATVDIPLPTVKGTYSVWATAYFEETNEISEPSDVTTITIAKGADTWEPEPLKVPMRLCDLVDVNLTDLLNKQMLAYDAATGTWYNKTGEGGGGAAGSALTIVDTLPTPSQAAYSDGQLYLQDKSLYYMAPGADGVALYGVDGKEALIGITNRGLLHFWDCSSIDSEAHYWRDRVGKADFMTRDCVLQANGVKFTGAYDAFCESVIPFELLVGYHIEIAYTPSTTDNFILIAPCGMTSERQITLGTYGNSYLFAEHRNGEQHPSFVHTMQANVLTLLSISDAAGYVDNVHMERGPADGWGGDGQSHVLLGKRTRGDPALFTGVIHSIRIYKEPLTEAERLLNYNYDLKHIKEV